MLTHIALMKLAKIMPYGVSPYKAGRTRSSDGVQKKTMAYIEPSIALVTRVRIATRGPGNLYQGIEP